MFRKILWYAVLLAVPMFCSAAPHLRVLNFYGSNGFQHTSVAAGITMLENICRQNKWQLTSTSELSVFDSGKLAAFDVIIFNNNCGNNGRIFNDAQQKAFQAYIRNGGGFVAIHCAGAIWHEGGDFQAWYEQLVGARMIDHPAVQPANCIVENSTHGAVAHLPPLWRVTDEYHRLALTPGVKTEVLLSVDESSYQGKEKMNGYHPLVWCHRFDGGRSFFSSLGHTAEIYANPQYIRLIEGGIRWAGGIDTVSVSRPKAPDGLMVDLDANKLVEADGSGRVELWGNSAPVPAVGAFVKQDRGRTVKGEGRPLLVKNVTALNGRNTIVFKKEELVAHNEDAFDHLITGSGYTWFCVIKPGLQYGTLKDVHSFFGNLKNGQYYEGLWAGLADDNGFWAGSRNGKSFGRWDDNNPFIVTRQKLDTARYYLLTGRMGAGTDTVSIALYINDALQPAAIGRFPVNPQANASKMAIGQERDAIEHPGVESFVGEIAKFLLYDRPLTDKMLRSLQKELMKRYRIR